MDYESITIAGRVGKAPEMRYTPTGQAVTSFSMATNKAKADGKKITKWYRITAWGKQAETVNQYLQQGQEVLVEGELQGDETTGSPRIWQRQDGTPGTSFEVSARTVRFGAKKNGSGEGQPAGDNAPQFAGAPEDEIPF